MRGFNFRKNINRAVFVSFLSAVIITLGSTKSSAVPAAPHFNDLEQPDGTKISARQWGDEHSHGWETDAGHTIVFDEKLRGWAYADRDNAGKLTSSAVLATKSATAPSWIQKRLRPLKSPSTATIPSKISSANNAPAFSVKTTGTKNIPVILINFSDTAFTYTAANFQTLLFGNSNSMKAYYLENSYGQLTLSSGSSGVVGPYTVSNTHDYYGQDVGGKGKDAHAAALVSEAVQKAVTAGFKFAPYVDQTTTCTLDSVAIIHQGTGQEAGGVTTDIWSHSWDLSSATGFAFDTGENCSLGGHILVDHYVIQPEKLWSGMTTFGVFAHEYGHVLGLPDLYDTTNASEGAGKWSIMAGGAWLGSSNNGDSPAHFDACSKYYLGWISPISISGVNSNLSIAAASSASPNFYKIGVGTPTAGEFFLVENRNKSGFDLYLPGAGLLTWHIDGTTISANYSTNTVNDYACTSTVSGACSGTSAHYGVALIQSDNALHLENNVNQGDADDPYYSPKTLTDLTLPNTKFWSGASSGFGVTSISAASTTMTATLIGPPILPAIATGSASTVTLVSGTLNGTVNDNNSGTAVSFDYGLSAATYGTNVPATTGGSISAGTGVTNSSVNLTSLSCNTTYHYRIKAINGVGTSDGNDMTFTTTPCVPGAPIIDSASAGNGQAGLNFVTPSYIGTSAISGFTVSPVGYAVDINSTLPITVPSLINGMEYIMSMTASNIAGTGPASNSKTITPGIAVVEGAYSTGYQTIQEAYVKAQNYGIIRLVKNLSHGELKVDSTNVVGTVSLVGGYNNALTLIDGTASITNKVTLSAGKTIFQNIVIKSP